jgi:hypothetical protein
MVTTRSSSAKQKGLVKAPDWEALHLAVVKEERFRGQGSLADPKKRSQLQYILDSDFYWGDAKTIEDCSDEGMVDDGILFYKELTSSHTNGVGASSSPPASTTVAKEKNPSLSSLLWWKPHGILVERKTTARNGGGSRLGIAGGELRRRLYLAGSGRTTTAFPPSSQEGCHGTTL